MVKKNAPLTAPYSKYSDAELQDQTGIYFANMDGVPEFAPIQPKLTAYGHSVSDFRNAVVAAASGDRNKINAKNALRETLIEDTISLGFSVVELADGNTSILDESGMPKRKTRQSAKIKIPEGLVLTAGNQPGTLNAKWKDIRAKRLFFVGYTSNPLDEKSSWTIVNSTKSSCKLSGLESGTKVWVRIGVIGSGNETIWGNAILSPYIP